MSIQSRINILRMCIYFIAAVCVYDIYCTIYYVNTLADHELNPIAKLLISQEIVVYHISPIPKSNNLTNEISLVHTDVSKLILFKVLGLVASLEIFDWLITSKYTASTTFIILLISFTQLILLLILIV